MNKLLILGAAGLGLIQIGSAATMCMNGTLADYISLGSTGCSIGGNTVSGFKTLVGTTGATEIASGLVTVTPSGGTVNPGLTFVTNVMAGNGIIFETLFNYSISGSNYLTTAITLSNLTGGGSYLQNFCQGGNFGPDGVTGCTGPNNGLAVVGNGADMASFSGVPTLLNITDDLTIDGTDGPSSGATAMDRFSATSSVPEPASFMLAGLGLAFAFFVKSRLSMAVPGSQAR